MRVDKGQAGQEAQPHDLSQTLVRAADDSGESRTPTNQRETPVDRHDLQHLLVPSKIHLLLHKQQIRGRRRS
jgi:hypothetical protein